MKQTKKLVIVNNEKIFNNKDNYYCENIDKYMSSKKDAEKFLNHHGYRGLNKRRLAENIYHLYLKR